MVEGFAGLRCVMEGREENEYHGVTWTESDHDLDFIFTRDYVGYGVEVKNTLGYIDKEGRHQDQDVPCTGLDPGFRGKDAAEDVDKRIG